MFALAGPPALALALTLAHRAEPAPAVNAEPLAPHAAADPEPASTEPSPAEPIRAEPGAADATTPTAARPAARPPRSGRGLLIAGGVLTGVGLAGRIGIEVFLAAVADLRPREPYGDWSVGAFFMATSFSNAPTLAGLGLLSAGAHRKGRAQARAGARAHAPARLRLGWGLLGGGVGLWALSRALFYPWIRACTTNGCAYGYLESTYWASAGLAVAGLSVAMHEVGLRRAEAERAADHIPLARAPRLHLTPLLGPQLRGLALGGRF